MKSDMEAELSQMIGARLRRARRSRHISQKNLADYLGISFQQVQKYETGKNRITAARLLACAILLNKPVDYFLRDARARLTGKPLLDPTEAPPPSNEEAEIHQLGCVLYAIADKPFRDQLLALAKRHNKIVTETGGEYNRTT